MTDWVVVGIIKKQQDDSLNIGDRLFVKKGATMYMDKAKGEVKIE